MNYLMNKAVELLIKQESAKAWNQQTTKKPELWTERAWLIVTLKEIIYDKRKFITSTWA